MLLLACQSLCFAAETEKAEVLRVPFTEVEGLMETAEDGSRHGVIVDYFSEIAKYTGWKYQYIDTEPRRMVTEFLNREYDLMGGTYYSPEFEEHFAYPNYSCGHSKVLLARQHEYSVRSYNVESLDGKTIGVYENAQEGIRRLNEYLLMNAVDCTLKSYTYDQLTHTSLTERLKRGEVDLVLESIADDCSELHVVAAFNAQPHYIVTAADNQEILDQLNFALENIIDSNPNFAEERYAVHYPNNIVSNVFLNEQELEYIRQKKVVTVAMLKSYHPLDCRVTEDGSHNGMVPDFLEKVTEFTGLKFEYLYADDYLDMLNMVQEKQADIAGFYLGSEAEAVQDGSALTKSYVTMNDIIVHNKSVRYPADGLAAPNEQEIQQHYLYNAVPVTRFYSGVDISFALSWPAQAELLTLLNKSITRLSDEERSMIANQNMISVSKSRFALEDLVYSNPVMFVSVVALVLFLAVFVILMLARYRMHAAVMRSELEKAGAENKAKGAFLSRMSHEIRTPMNAVVGLSDLTSMMKGVPEQVQSNLVKIRASSHYLLGLINDILDMSRVDSGMLTLVSEPFSLKRMLTDLKSMMQAEAQRQGLEFTMEADVLHEVLKGDEIRLRQVLTNLLSNALKFTPSGGHVQLRVVETGADEQGATFKFRVIDDGNGISPDDQQRTFDAFEQAGTSLSRSQGTGLGLPISSIVRLMGGELKLDSELGKGSTFYFTVALPFGELPEEADVSGDTALLEGYRLLLVEDNELNAEIAAQLLEMQGAAVQVAPNGKQAVERFASSAPGEIQAILMDIQMPEMNGLEATRAIRALDRPDAASVPIIAMTANSFQEDIDAAMQAGMNGFIAKPLDVHILYTTILDLLRKHRE